eukprot:s4944_g4.t1
MKSSADSSAVVLCQPPAACEMLHAACTDFECFVFTQLMTMHAGSFFFMSGWASQTSATDGAGGGERGVHPQCPKEVLRLSSDVVSASRWKFEIIYQGAFHGPAEQDAD